MPKAPAWRTGTGLLLLFGSVATAAGWGLRSTDWAVSSVLAWRIGFFGLLAAATLNLGLLRAVWRGRAHFATGFRRFVPFEPGEFRGSALLDPRRDRSGVRGRGGLAGAGLVGVAACLWLGGLAFAPLETTGTLSLGLGQSTSDIRPMGLRPTGVSYAYALEHEHTFLGLDDSGLGVLMGAQDPRTNEQGEYTLRPGRAVVLGDYRVSLSATSVGPPVAGLRLLASGPEGEYELSLRRGSQARVGSTSWELVEIRPNFEGSEFEAMRVRQRGPETDREVWVLPDQPEITAAVGAGQWRLRPLERLYAPRVELRLTRGWVWWWRLAILVLAVAGSLLLVLVPHYSWVWLGPPGDYQLRAWSLNANRSLHTWTREQLLLALGREGLSELEEIERELAAGSGKPSD